MLRRVALSAIAAVFVSGVFGVSILASKPLVVPIATIPPEFFGMHIQRATAGTKWPHVPFRSWRLAAARVHWSDLQPERDEFDFRRLDEYLELANRHHIELMLSLMLTPPWATSQPDARCGFARGTCAPPRDLEDWRKYVTTIGSRYKGKIRLYEVWNEPNLKEFWTGEIETMIAMTTDAARILHAIDPGNVVISPPMTGDAGVSYLDRFLAQGGGRDVDVIGYHFYVTPRPPEAMVGLIASVKKTMTRYGLVHKPLWNTESGWSRNKVFRFPDEAASYVARTYILNWAGGVSRVYWYAWDDLHWIGLRMIEDGDKPTRAAEAYRVIQRWLSGAVMTSCSEQSDGTWVAELQRQGRRQWILWNPHRVVSFTIPEDWRAMRGENLRGEPLALGFGKLELGDSPIMTEQYDP